MHFNVPSGNRQGPGQPSLHCIMSWSAAVTGDGWSREFEDWEPEEEEGAAVEAGACDGAEGAEADVLAGEADEFAAGTGGLASLDGAGAVFSPDGGADTAGAPEEAGGAERTVSGRPKASDWAVVHEGAGACAAEAPADRAETGEKSITKASKIAGNSRDMISASKIGPMQMFLLII